MISLSKVSRSIRLQKPSSVLIHDLVLRLLMKIDTWDLAGNGSADFGFGIFEEFNKRGDHVTGNDFFVHGFSNLPWSVSACAGRSNGNTGSINTFSYLSATMYLTLQLLSSNRLRKDVNKTP